MDTTELNPRVVGHIVAVQGFRVKVELLPETKSPSRATLDGVHTAIAINAYLTFSIGAGQSVIGVITDLESREAFDPASGDELTLELVKPRRVASVQLLGTVEFDEGKGTFNAGITVLPTLDAAAEIGAPELLKAVFENPPKRNKPSDYEGDDYDCDLRLGHPTGQRTSVVRASYNDLFSRPVAIVGNTGSGKSFTVSSIVQKAMHAVKQGGNEPHIFILDVNGEYARAFLDKPDYERLPDRIYLNGKPFGVPVWLMNSEEVCAWLKASEQTQEPVLKDWWAIAKAESAEDVNTKSSKNLRLALAKATVILEALDAAKAPVRQNITRQLKVMEPYLEGVSVAGLNELKAEIEQHNGQLNAGNEGQPKLAYGPPPNEKAIRDACEAFISNLRTAIGEHRQGDEDIVRTADSPIFVPHSRLQDPVLVERSSTHDDASRIESHLTTLKLRLRTRLEDRRWKSFLNYEQADTKFESLEAWLSAFGVGEENSPKVVLIDLSMLSHEVLPFACSVIGRVLLEVRERIRAVDRYKHPWVLVLEEAHNYARPARSDEERGQSLSRLAFERIAKEGRKFGLSLVIASQRPSEISPTIISQCANFISHRLQNPDDIDHFRRIIPAQARRLLDQVTILASGEAIAFGSAFHIPTRVHIEPPCPTPYSQTAAPFVEWRRKSRFPVGEVIDAWGLNKPAAAPAIEGEE